MLPFRVVNESTNKHTRGNDFRTHARCNILSYFSSFNKHNTNVMWLFGYTESLSGSAKNLSVGFSKGRVERWTKELQIFRNRTEFGLSINRMVGLRHLLAHDWFFTADLEFLSKKSGPIDTSNEPHWTFIFIGCFTLPFWAIFSISTVNFH